MADCRKCVYFKNIIYLDYWEYQRAMRTARQRNEKLYGFCKYYQRGVTYLCSGFKEDENKRPKLSDFFKKEG